MHRCCCLLCARRWNQLDVLIIVLSISGIVLEIVNDPHSSSHVHAVGGGAAGSGASGVLLINPTIIRVFRVLRIARGTCAAFRSFECS